ncbi:metallophosphoesterase family protein [Phenylobacterium sp.]|uniref:metallophosphoesterase family protein n=1 Tax=Phenylobacterium sp. TaxID=1871053 RepID=UPI002736774A|nr:metallophosphoesterase family protein [Phenylobacterium sp.]MDP3659461.1 metallophosphoesterase family protein [Phenylobacterium sp.]
MFSKLFPKPVANRTPPNTGGRLIYAVGDVHGRLDVLEPLIAEIAADAARSRPAHKPLLIFLGDYVDRGDASAGVIDLILRLQADNAFEVVALKGNHEEALFQFLDDPSFGPLWIEHGGGPTLASYGAPAPVGRGDAESWMRTRDAFAAALPDDHRRFLESLELIVTVGDYAFVHAGVRPGAPLERQTEHDLLWIRHDFLQANGPFEKVIVHGHTPAEAPQITPHRICVDTGVYATGVLTAVRLDADGPRFLQAGRRQAA